MSDQNHQNHGRYVPVWHFITPLIIIVILGMSIINLVHSDMDARDLHMWLPIILIPLVLLILWWYARAFALRAQDRAIRAEENFRYYLLTGKPLDNKLSMGQIIALRFASDAELPALAKRTVEENLSSKEIKQAIQHWRAHYNRV
jgi:Zn-dependent protease with chaperone function